LNPKPQSLSPKPYTPTLLFASSVNQNPKSYTP